MENIKTKCKPKVSIIIPVYNTEAYIDRCLISVLNQSYKEIEIIIVNDSSSDNSENVILKYVNKHNLIKYFKSSENNGAGGARNIALEIATGDYISFIDSDDWVDSNMIEKMIHLLEKHNGTIAVCGVTTEFTNPKDATCRYNYELENVIDGEFGFELLTRSINQDISISPIVCNKIYSSSFIKKHSLNFLTNSINEDDVFNFIAFFNAEKIVITPNTYYHYFQRQNSNTHQFSKKHIEDLINAFKIIKEYLIEKNGFQLYMNSYFSYFEKCLSYVIDMLMASEPSYRMQNEYIKYLFLISKDVLTTEDYLGYIGLRKIKNFLLPYNMK